MCSLKWPAPLGSDPVGVMLEAVSRIAERNFYAVVEPCDADRFAALAAEETGVWMVAKVAFTEADCTGVVTCHLSQELAYTLFDAFTGRDPLLDPPPASDALDDLVGEFTNMICGSWLTLLANRQTFELSRPEVRRLEQAPLARPDAPLLLTLNDRPFVVQVGAERLRQADRGNSAA